MSTDKEVGKVSWSTPLIRLRFLISALLMAFLCYGFFTWILWPVKVSGLSMMPNYRDGSRHFINKLAYLSARPQRGDVVALRASDGDVYLKRIVGLPGEVISFERGILHVNGVPQHEAYTQARVPFRWRETVLLGKEQYYVIGDNRTVSILTPVWSSQIIGKVTF